MKAAANIQIQKNAEGYGNKLIKRPLTAYRSNGPACSQIDKFAFEQNSLKTQKNLKKTMEKVETEEKFVVESMCQLDWFDKSQLSKNRSNRYPKAHYREAQDYNRRFRELME